MLNPIDYSISKFVTFANEETLNDIRAISQTLRYKKGATIETRGDAVDHLFLIDEGLVQLGIDSIDGSRFNLARLGPGHTFDETPFFAGHKAVFDKHAESDVVLLKLSGKNIDDLMSRSLVFSKALVTVASMRVHATLSYIGDTLGLSLEARVAKQIMSVSRSAGRTDTINVRQVDLAHSLGVSRVSIGKALKALAGHGLIKIRYGKLDIIDRGQLKTFIIKSQKKY